MKLLGKSILALAAILVAGTASALPALQLGPDPDNPGDWTYDTTTGTWVYVGSGSPTPELYAYANAPADDGGDGDWAWDFDLGEQPLTAYLVVSAVPKTGDATDVFDVTLTGDGGSLTLVESGWGAPPLADTNSLAPHGIFDTYYEIYEFVFDGSQVTIGNTQPGDTGSGVGYVESFEISFALLDPSITGIHFDLFTVEGDGTDLSRDVMAFAPFSHDATVPEPGTLSLLGGGLLAAGLMSRRRRKSRKT